MFRSSAAVWMRVLCLTMQPDGGAMTPALTTLGYQPYTLKACFKGHARTHPMEWSNMLQGKKNYDPSLFTDYDSFIGPPAAVLYDAILRECPSYTKVILVEEPDKEAWATNFDRYMEKLAASMKRTSRNRIGTAFNHMLEHMVVRGDVRSNTATAAAPTSVKSFGFRRRDGAADAATTSSAASNDVASTNIPKDMESATPHPRAQALAKFEESVKLHVPNSKLLVYRYGDGWSPLCEFLEKEVPDQPFPPYDDGLRVLGNLQERVERARILLRLLVSICLAIIVVRAMAYMGGARKFFSDLYIDFREAYTS